MPILWRLQLCQAILNTHKQTNDKTSPAGTDSQIFMVSMKLNISMKLTVIDAYISVFVVTGMRPPPDALCNIHYLHRLFTAYSLYLPYHLYCVVKWLFWHNLAGYIAQHVRKL